MRDKHKCILFDCDGVLVDSEILALRVELKEYRRLGLEISETYYRENLLGFSEKEVHRNIHRVAREQNCPLPTRGLAAQLSKLRKEAYIKELTPVDGMHDFLQKYDGEIAVVTSSTLDSVRLKLRLEVIDLKFLVQALSQITMWIDQAEPVAEYGVLPSQV